VRRLAGEPARGNAAADEPVVDWNHGQHFNYDDREGNVIYRNTRYPLLKQDGSPVITTKGKPDKTFVLSRLQGRS
jgi:hypothetical protein